ncbi:MAG: class C sortase [Solobacterium sp.]|nr:class C sortase [Solobacterium sp.]
MAKKKKNGISNWILVGIMILGLLILAYPTFANWWNSIHQSRAIARYVEAVSSMKRDDYDKIFAEADSYNKDLLADESRYALNAAEIERYKKVLDITGTGIMGYIDIPKINVSYPIYHGTDEAVLQIAIGHLEFTSLPSGGLGTHCALSGHRGLPSARLFTDIDQLVVGDTFMIQVLDRTLTYEVDQIREVLPEELQDLQIEADKDYCTLITCTPYGINTHRLLVRGHRVENAASQVRVVADAIQIRAEYVAPLVMIPMLTVLLIVLLITTGKKKRNA